MKALVTGGSGYLGSHVCKMLKQDGWTVISYDTKIPEHDYVDMILRNDIRESQNLDLLFSKVKIDVVFHFAGRIEVGESVNNPTEFYDVNTGGTCILLNAMKKHGVNNIVYSSTAAVYETSDEPLEETDPVTIQNSPYGGSKLCSEYAIRQSGLNHIIFRYFNLAGADLDGDIGENHVPETHLIPRIIENLNKFEIYGNDYDTPDGTCVRDYVHVSDVSKAHIQAAKHLLNGNESFILNLGTGRGNSVKEIVAQTKIAIGKNINVTYLPRRAGDPSRLVANISLAEKVLNYRPEHDIMSILKTAYNWHTK